MAARNKFQIFMIALFFTGACFAQLGTRKMAKLVNEQATSTDVTRKTAKDNFMGSNPLLPKITKQDHIFEKHFYTDIMSDNFRKSIYDIFDETTTAGVAMDTVNTLTSSTKSSTSSSKHSHLDITWNLAGRLLKVRGKRRVTQDDESEVGGADSSQHGGAAGAASLDRDVHTVPETLYNNIHS